jgi:glutamate/tyrosine decarboxylase-like PLP-dependent enzyme
MGAGLYLTRHTRILEQTFCVAAPYMPRGSDGPGAADPYARSMQWSRRFIGLKVFLSLAVAGWEGYAESIRHQVAMGEYLRRRLTAEGWEVVNNSPLPVVCFADLVHPNGRSSTFLNAVASRVVSSGRAWISTTTLAGGVPVLRACVTNYRTRPEDVDALLEALGLAREQSALVTEDAGIPGRAADDMKARLMTHG